MSLETTIPKGRPKGAQTLRRVKMSDLNKHLSEGAEIPVAQNFLTAIGIPYPKED